MLNELLERLKKILHRHQWRGMGWHEWHEHGGPGTPDWICDKCGERRMWSDTKRSND